MAFEKDEDDRDRRKKTASQPDIMDNSETPRKKAGAPGVGNALREAYQEALREDVPPEMLDLLGKLG